MTMAKKVRYLYTIFMLLFVLESGRYFTDGAYLKETTRSTKQFDENRLLTPLPQTWFTEDAGWKAIDGTPSPAPPRPAPITTHAPPLPPTTVVTGQPSFALTDQTPETTVTGSTVASSLGNDTSTSTTNASAQNQAFYSYIFLMTQWVVLVYKWI